MTNGVLDNKSGTDVSTEKATYALQQEQETGLSLLDSRRVKQHIQQADTFMASLASHVSHYLNKQHLGGAKKSSAEGYETITEPLKRDCLDIDDDDELLSEDYRRAYNSFSVENPIDITGIIAAYPFYITTIYYILNDVKPSEVSNPLYVNAGSLSTFVGFLCGISFTSAAGIPIKEILSDQERENKIKMAESMYKHILQSLVMVDIHKISVLNSALKDYQQQIKNENLTVEQNIELISKIDKLKNKIQGGKNNIYIKIEKELSDTKKSLEQIEIIIGAKNARLASDENLTGDQRKEIEKEINANVRTQLAYQERMKFLEGLNETVRREDLLEAKSKLEEKIVKEKDFLSRDIVNDLHRPNYDSISFEAKVFGRAEPIKSKRHIPKRDINGKNIIQDQYNNTITREIRPTIITDKDGKESTVNLEHIVFKNQEEKTFLLEEHPHKGQPLKYTTQFETIQTGADVLNNYGVPAARVHYEILLERAAELATLETNKDLNIIDKAFEHLKYTMFARFFSKPKKIDIANSYLKNTLLAGFFSKPENKDFSDYLFQQANQNIEALGTDNQAKKTRKSELEQAVKSKKTEIFIYDDVFNNYTVRKSTSHYAVLIQLIARLLPHHDPHDPNIPGENYANWIAIGSSHLKGTVLENYFKDPNAKHLQEMFFRASRQRRVYLAERKLDPDNVYKVYKKEKPPESYSLYSLLLKILIPQSAWKKIKTPEKNDIIPSENPTYRDKQQLHAEDLARDINRKKDEILFYENKYKILNPTLTEVEQSELQKTLEKSAKEKSESITMNTKNAAASSSSSAFAEKARNENNTANLPATEHVILAQPYDTQVLSYAERLWSEIVHLGQTIAYFYNSILEGNKPNKDLRDQNERIKNYELYGIHPNLRQLILAYAYNHIVYPVQDFITSKDNNIILRSIGFICYIPFFFTYKITWAFANFPTLLETLEESVDALGKGVHNLSESLIGSKNDSLFSLVLFKPLKKAVVTPFLTVGKGVFGFLYWILWPFANGGTMRKAARMLVWRPFAEPVDRACDVLDPLYNYLCKWEEKLDDKSFEWRDLGEYFLIYLGYFGLLFPYGLIQLYLLPTAAFCWFINDVIKPIFFSIPIVSAIFSLVYSFIRNETHDLAEKKVDDVKSTIGTKFSIFFQRFFVQPYKNTWSWFKTEWNEVDRLNKINYYGKHALWGDNTGIKYAFRADLIGKLILASVGNFFLGIAYSIMTFLKQAPVLTFISFSTSTLAAGATLPIIGTLAFHETISGYLMIAPMVFEPVNTTRDKYNNAMAQKFVKAQHELKTPVKFYRRFIRHYLLKKLAAAGYTNLNSDGRATNKDDPRYQIALTELETRTYARMPRVPMDECDVKEHLDKLFSGDHPISMENLVPDDLTNVTFAEQKVEKHNHRVKWATECIEYAFYVNRGKEIWKDTKTHMPSDTIIKSQETKDLENSSQDTIKDKMAIAFSTFKDYLNSFIDIKLNEKINENTHEAYKIFLANLLADLFSVNEEARNKHLEYFLKNDDLNTVIDYFFGQYQISDDFEGLSEHYKEDCKYAFVGFAEMVADRFTQVASEERYRRSLMKSPARIFYIDKNGAAIPCIDTLDTNGILKLEFIENGVQKNVTFISRESNLHVDSPLIHNRYDEGVKSNDDIQMDHFIYSQNNCHIDLNLTMAALAKDFDKIETPKNNEEHNDTQPNPKANSSCTRMPVLNFKQGYDAKTPSACHLNNAYNAPALPKWKDHQETKLTDNKIVISEYEGNGSDKMETEEPEIIPEEKWPTKNSYPQFRTMLKTLSLQAPVLPSEPNHLRKITNKAL